MLYKQHMSGNTLIITLIFLSVVALLTFSATVNSQLQQRMSHQLQLKMLANHAADMGVIAFYDWLIEDPERWESATWPTGEWVNVEKQSYFSIPESSLVWAPHFVTFEVEGAIINESGALSESSLRVRFHHSPDSGRIYLDHWLELQ